MVRNPRAVEVGAGRQPRLPIWCLTPANWRQRYSSVIDQTCASIGLVQGTNCNMIPGQGLDIGRPLIQSLFPLGTMIPASRTT